MLLESLIIFLMKDVKREENPKGIVGIISLTFFVVFFLGGGVDFAVADI